MAIEPRNSSSAITVQMALAGFFEAFAESGEACCDDRLEGAAEFGRLCIVARVQGGHGPDEAGR